MSPHKRKKESVLDIEDQHCQRPWSTYREQQQLIQKNHSATANIAASRACRRLVDGDYLDWSDLFGER